MKGSVKMTTQNMYVQIMYDEETKTFNCRADLGEILTTLKDGDIFTLIHQGVDVLGTIKKCEKEFYPYGFGFVSNDGNLKVELNDGMYGYVKRES